jgi:uncharacterized protein (DUF1697 family)
MAELKQFLFDIGLELPVTLLQSGNVVFRSPLSPTELEEFLKREAEGRLGLKSEFFVRTAGEWDQIVRNNPFPDEAVTDPSHLVVLALRTPPDSALVETVRAAVKGRERFQAVDNQLYIVYPDGIGASEVSKTPGWNKLTGAGTARNWNTVLKLQALLQEDA